MPSPFRMRSQPLARWPKSNDPGVQDLGEDLGRLDQPRPGPVEVLVTVDHRHAPRADRVQGLPAGQPLERRRFARACARGRSRTASRRSTSGSAARTASHSSHGRVLADGAEEVAGRRRARPAPAPSCPPPSADRSTRRTRCAADGRVARARGERVQPLAQARDDRRAARRARQRRGDALDVGEHVVQARSERARRCELPRPAQSHVAATTSASLTAHTSHCVCVTITSGASARSASASTR